MENTSLGSAFEAVSTVVTFFRSQASESLLPTEIRFDVMGGTLPSGHLDVPQQLFPDQ
jgi:hypothetical protein